MKTYCFDQTEINLVLKCLRYAVEYGYTAELSDDECSEYVDLKDLIDRIDPKPVQREGWMVVWDGTSKYCKTSVIEDKEEADRLLGAMGGYPNVRIVRVTWEE